MSRKRSVSLVSAVGALVLALWPRAAAADQCEFTNPGACIDGSIYSFYRGIAVTVWSLDRTLLVLAYQLDYLRWWLATQMFDRLFASVRVVAEPFLTPLATVAVIVGLLLFLLVPVIGRVNLINIRQIFMLLFIVPMLLASAASWFLEMEGWRSDVAGAITQQVGQVNAQNMFGGANSDADAPMARVEPIYAPYGGPSACAAVPVTRPPTVSSTSTPNGIHLDDLAAALLLANAQDLHCPGEQGNDSSLPDGFSAGDVFTVDGQVETRSAPERAQAIQNIQRGITRLLLGIGACVLAVFEYLVQLIFSLAIMALWLFLPFVLLLMLFQESLGLLGSLIQRLARVCITSWVVSVLIGMLGGLLFSAANTGSATAYVSLSFGGLFIIIRLFLIAVDVLRETFMHTVGGTLGITGAAALSGATGQLGRLAAGGGRGVRGALGRVRATASAGTRAALTGALAARTTGSARYAFGAAAGTFRPLAQVGAVAASMGFVSDEISSGLYSGERAARTSYGAAARQMQSDVRRPLEGGTTIRDRARRRAIENQLTKADRPTLLESGEQTAQRAVDALGYTLAPTGLRSDLAQAGDRLIENIQSGRTRLQSSARMMRTRLSQPNGIQTTAQDATLATGAALEQGVLAGAQALASGADALYERDLARRPGARRYQAQRLDANGKVRWSDATPPDDALVVPASAIQNRAALLAAGYTVQNQRNGEVAIWSDQPEAPAAVPASAPAAERRRASLIKAGYLAASTSTEPVSSTASPRMTPANPTSPAAEANGAPHPTTSRIPTAISMPQTGTSVAPSSVPASVQPTDPATTPTAATAPVAVSSEAGAVASLRPSVPGTAPAAAVPAATPAAATPGAPEIAGFVPSAPRKRRRVVIQPEVSAGTQHRMPLDQTAVAETPPPAMPGTQPQAESTQPRSQQQPTVPTSAGEQRLSVPATVLKSSEPAAQQRKPRTPRTPSREKKQ